jgi:uncharacterized protein YkwD
MLRWRSLTAFIMAALLPLAIFWQPAFAADAGLFLPGDPAAANLIVVEQALLDLTNVDRAAHGLDPLVFDPDTLDIARERAESQLGPQSLSHYDATGQLIFAELLNHAQLSYQLAGENLARSAAYDPLITDRVETALMNSPLHRKNILEPTFTRVSVGAATDASGEVTFAEVYRN